MMYIRFLDFNVETISVAPAGIYEEASLHSWDG